MATYLVTGAAGFIASRTASLLIEAGHRVVGVDNLNDAYDPEVKRRRLAELQKLPGFELHQIDICDRPALEKVFAESAPIDAIINLAARAGVRQSVENPWIYIDTNVTGTLNLLEQAKTHDIKKFVLASTSSLYGARNPIPYEESQDTNGPLSPYAASKKSAEAVCHSYHHLFGIDVTIFRFFTVYGPFGRPDMSLFRFTQWTWEDRPVTIFGDGKQSRDFTYVDDVARGVIAGVRPLGYEVINLGSDAPFELADVLGRLEKRIGKTAKIDRQPFHKADIRATWANIEKAKRLLDWTPQVTLDEGLNALVDWYRENRDWAKDVATGR